jgi:hypothetical protein
MCCVIQYGEEEELFLTNQETAEALRNENCTIIPVVNSDFKWPEKDDLPEDMQRLPKHNHIK